MLFDEINKIKCQSKKSQNQITHNKIKEIINLLTNQMSVQPTISPQQILFNPLNNSTSKFQFSFSKAERFHSAKKSKIKTQADDSYRFYDIPSTNSKKAPSFGIGQKTVVFNIKTEVPPATKYSPTLLDDFQHYGKNANKERKGFSFTVGRENVKSLSFMKKNQNPGPGIYNPDPEKVMSHSFYNFSMTKNQRFFDQRQKAKSSLDDSAVPGPGHYRIKSTLGGENKLLSQDTNNNPCLRLTNSKNESRKKYYHPNPKIYNPQVTRVGDFTTFNKNRGFSMGKSKRSNLIKINNVPGPGNYRIFSQFITKVK